MDETTAVFFGAEFWVLVAFVIFALVLVRMRVHTTVVGSVDKRAAMIRAELDQARSLREEAQRVLGEYQQKRSAAEQEAASIIAAAREEADRLAVEAKSKAEDFVARRTKMAEQKIAQAEAQAVADVRAAAAEAAVSAAEKILTDTVKGKVADDLIGRGIGDVKAKLN
jgi:F-type H+-transporting ATPase subunit b